MSDKYEKLDETFNTEPVEVEVQKADTNAKIEKIKSGQEDIRRDYEYTRGNLYSIIEKVSGNKLTVKRGQDTSTAAEHVLGAGVATITANDANFIEVGDDFGFDGSIF